MITKNENKPLLDLNNTIDLSTYCPEKALHLECMNLTHEPMNKCRELSEIIDQEIKLRQLFINHFALLWSYREGICNTPEFANIPVTGAGYVVGINHHAILGELLFLYNYGKLRLPQSCEKCKGEMLLYKTGGLPGSGAGVQLGFCPNCGNIRHTSDGHGYYQQDFLGQKCPCPKSETQWTMADLISALQNTDKYRYATKEEIDNSIKAIFEKYDEVFRKLTD